jgi:hypothetical protein
MATTYTYSVASLRKEDQTVDDVVVSATFDITATDSTNTVSGSVDVRFGEIDTLGSFIDYTNLTETDIVTWASDDPIFESTKQQLEKKLIVLTQDEVSSNFPWS